MTILAGRKVWYLGLMLACCSSSQRLSATNPPAFLPADDAACPVLPACITGPRATVTLRDVQRMQTATTGGVVSWASADPCDVPSATCSMPQPSQIVLTGNVVITKAPPTPLSIEDCLAVWELSSQNRGPLSERDQRWMERMSLPGVNAHTLEVAAALGGPVTVTNLERQFEWQLICQTASHCELRAVAVDETLRLFCPSLNVTLDLRSSALPLIELPTRDGKFVAVMWPATFGTVLTKTDFPRLDALPPSPTTLVNVSTAPLIRFAAGVVEVRE